MLQLDNQRGAPGSDYGQNPSSSLFPTPVIGNGNGIPVSTHTARNGPFMGLSSEPPGSIPAAISQGPGAVGSMIHWSTGSPQHLSLQPAPRGHQTGSGILNNNNNDNHSEDEDDDDYRPFTPPPPRERLSYTRYQLELLNGIYNEVRYPNSTQKQLIAKRVGITREQVKIWFQNRRRKDVVSKGGKGDPKDIDANSNPDPSPPNSASGQTKADCDDTDMSPLENDLSGLESSSSVSNVPNDSSSGRTSTGSVPDAENESSDSKDQMVSKVVLNSIVAELQKFNNEYLKQKKNRKKSKSKSAKRAASLAAAAAVAAVNGTAASCKLKRLFQSYDMVAPPNKVTPTAFLNTTANRFKHAGGTSAFQNPRENRLLSIPSLSLGESRIWDGFSLGTGHSLPNAGESSDLLQQRSPADHSTIPAIPSSLASSFGIHNQPHQQAFSGLLSGSMAAVHHLNSQTSLYDNLPVLSDLLSPYKNQPSASAMAAAAVAHRQQLEHSLLSSSQSPGRPLPTSSFFHLPGTNHSSSTGSIRSSSANSTNDDSSKSPLSDLTFPSPSGTHNPFSFNPHHSTSTFPINRVFPFPLIADPPVMLSSIRQSDSLRSYPHHPPQWPPPPSSLSHSTPGHSFVPHQINPSSNEVPTYKPLLISSLSNPYFSPTSSHYSFTPPSLQPPPPHWSSSPSGTNSTEFAQL